jgi:hypothetical protein
VSAGPSHEPGTYGPESPPARRDGPPAAAARAGSRLAGFQSLRADSESQTALTRTRQCVLHPGLPGKVALHLPGKVQVALWS